MSRIRHTCIECKKKKEERYMVESGVSHNCMSTWKCKSCNDENRMYGQNRRVYGYREREEQEILKRAYEQSLASKKKKRK